MMMMRTAENPFSVGQHISATVQDNFSQLKHATKNASACAITVDCAAFCRNDDDDNNDDHWATTRTTWTTMTTSTTTTTTTTITRRKLLWVQLPAKAKFGSFCRQHLATLATPTIRSIKCKQSPVYGVFWPLLPHPSTDRNKTRTWFSLSP